MAAIGGAAEGTYVGRLWSFLVSKEVLVSVITDSSSCRAFSQRQGVGRLKHIDTKYLWLQQSIKENVLPINATATVNFRLHPRDTIETVVAHVQQVVGPDIEVRPRPRGGNASPVASTSSEGFMSIASAAQDVLEDIIVAPGLTVAGTDSKHYAKVADDAYRFHPFVVTSEDIVTIHGTNERISIDNLVLGTDFFVQLMTTTKAPGG